VILGHIIGVGDQIAAHEQLRRVRVWIFCRLQPFPSLYLSSSRFLHALSGHTRNKKHVAANAPQLFQLNPHRLRNRYYSVVEKLKYPPLSVLLLAVPRPKVTVTASCRSFEPISLVLRQADVELCDEFLSALLISSKGQVISLLILYSRRKVGEPSLTCSACRRQIKESEREWTWPLDEMSKALEELITHFTSACARQERLFKDLGTMLSPYFA